jgi:hypothetical protein
MEGLPRKERISQEEEPRMDGERRVNFYLAQSQRILFRDGGT